jgi:hypothetical protein
MLLCPNCCEIISGSTDTTLVPHLQPLGLRSAFNSSIEPDLEQRARKQKQKEGNVSTGMEVLGGKEADLESDFDEGSTDDEYNILNTPAVPSSNRPKRLSIGGNKVAGDCMLQASVDGKIVEPAAEMEEGISPPTGMSTFIEIQFSCPPETIEIGDDTPSKGVQVDVPCGKDFSLEREKSEGSKEVLVDAELNLLLPPSTPEALRVDKVIFEESGEMAQDCSKVLQKKRNRLAPSDFPKRQTRNEGPAEDLSKILLKHKVGKQSRRKEVLQLLSSSPSKSTASPGADRRTRRKQ